MIDNKIYNRLTTSSVNTLTNSQIYPQKPTTDVPATPYVVYTINRQEPTVTLSNAGVTFYGVSVDSMAFNERTVEDVSNAVISALHNWRDISVGVQWSKQTSGNGTALENGYMMTNEFQVVVTE